MSKLNIKLNRKYKSFNADEEFQFEGNPIILSGANGSGKTQLLEIIRGKDPNDHNRYGLSTIQIDGETIPQTEISYRSFRDNINIPEIIQPTSRFQNANREQIWGVYNQNLLNPNEDSNLSFKSTINKLRNILIEEFGTDKFNSKGITHEDIMKTKVLDDFVWVNDDLFSNTIDKIFSEYLQKEHTLRLTCGDKGEKFDRKQLGIPPWEELNTLFKRLQFHYRFKDDYYMDNNTYEINENPTIYDIFDGITPDYNSPRNLSDLSDGEKSIISLVFSSLLKNQRAPRILLLDEIDATLNPFLIEAFYTIINEYFIKKGIQVIIATHSPVTIALAQDIGNDISFYEIFRKSPDRVIKVLPGNYSDLDGNFLSYLKRYKNEASQQKRYKTQLSNLNNILTSDKPLITFEGITDIKYFKKAIELLKGETSVLEKFDLKDGHGKDNMINEVRNLKEVISHGQEPKSRLMFFFDCDTSYAPVKITNLWANKINKIEENPIKIGIENLFPKETINHLITKRKDIFTLKEERNENGDITKTEAAIKNDFAKSSLCDHLCNVGTKDDFKNFEEIIDQVIKFIQ